MVAANPSAPGAGQTQQAPFGSSPVTGPTPNKGFEAAALKRMGLVVDQLTELLQLAGASTPLGKDILKMINMGAKHVPSGSVTPADKKQSLERQSMANTQNNQQMAALKQQMAQGQQQPQQAAA